MTHKEKYLAAGLELMPSGRINSYQMQRILGRLGSRKDSTWIRSPENRNKGRHSCCGSKRDYYHKASCTAIAALESDDLSDLKMPK